MNFRNGLVNSGALVALALGACTTTASCPPAAAPLPAKVVDTGCDWTKPIYPNSKDQLSLETAKQILSHDQAGQKNCNWQPLE